MAKINIRCNGEDKHVNEIDLDALLTHSPTVIYKGINQVNRDTIPPRIITDCEFCNTGKVIIKKEIILENIDREEPDENTGT